MPDLLHNISQLPLSVALTCRDNAGTIGRLLESLRLLRGGVEIVALDNGSTDETIAMLERAGARVIRGRWLGYAATKQQAMEACTRDWVLNLDSDESLQPGLARAITAAVTASAPDIVAYRMNRQTWYNDRPLLYAWQAEWITRLVRRGEAVWVGAEPHPRLQVDPGAGRSDDLPRPSRRPPGPDASLRHDSFRTFAEHLARQARYAQLSAEALHAEGERGSFWRLLTSPAGAFLKQMVLKRAFWDGRAGWLAAASTAAGTLMKHAALLELRQRSKPKDAPEQDADGAPVREARWLEPLELEEPVKRDEGEERRMKAAG